MKKTLLIALIGAFSVGFGYAQQASKLATPNINPTHFKSIHSLQAPITGNEKAVKTPHGILPSKNHLRSAETVVGTTQYDLQTNNSSCRRILNDGSNLYATWTMGLTFGSSTNPFPDRGTGFNMSTDGGDTWGNAPTARIEDKRVGWPNVGKTADGRLFVITHSGSQGLNFAYKDEGATDWENYVIPDDADATWPRMAVTGNTIYVIASRLDADFGGLTGGVSFFRNTQGGEEDAWEGPFEIPEFTDYFPSLGGDIYAIDAEGQNVAFVIGGPYRQTVLFKSKDGGENWTPTVISSVANAFADFTTIPEPNPQAPFWENGVTNAGNHTILVDAQGTAHVWYNRQFTIHTTSGGTPGLSSYLFDNGIMYWNESMAKPTLIGKTVLADYDGDKTFVADSLESGSYNSYVGHPSAGIDAQGNLYVAYDASRDAARDNNASPSDAATSVRYYYDVYLIKSTDGGATWTGPYNVSNNTNREDAYPSIARLVDQNVHLVYQSDDYTGNAVSYIMPGGGTPNTAGQEEFSTNEIVYKKVPIGDIVNNTADHNTEPILFGYATYIPGATAAGCADGLLLDTHAIDFPDGDLTPLITTNGVDLNTPGNYSFTTFSVTDSDDNTVETEANGGTAVDLEVIEDVDPPVIEVTQGSSDPVVILEVGDDYTPPFLTIGDNNPCFNLEEGITEADFTVDVSQTGVDTFKVVVVDPAGNVTTFQQIVYINAVGVQQTTPNNLPIVALYPNPSTGLVQLNLQNNAQKAQVTVVNLLGEIINQATFEGKYTLNLQHANKGVYFVTVKTDKGTATQKITIE